MNQNEYEDLIDTLKEKMLDGDVQAMRHLGDVYYQGMSGDEKNIADALPYWRRAADNGDNSVAYKVGYALYCGNGCEADKIAAIPYFKMAADAGNTKAQFSLGVAYMNGIGCAADRTAAKKYFEKAARKGDSSSQWYLGSLQFLDKDEDWLHWICCAHLGGVEEATNFLNQMIEGGTDRGVLDYQIELIQKNGIDPRNSGNALRSASAGSSSKGFVEQFSENLSTGGCYIATCVYGSYDCPQVWTLRRFRDNTLASTWYGRFFIHVYYAISPILVKWFGHTAWFKRQWKGKLDKLVEKLQKRGFESGPYQDKKQ